MSENSSVSRRLVFSVAVPLALFFVLTVVLLDSIFRGLSAQALRDRLDEQLIAVLASAEVSPEGRVELSLPDPESRLVTPDSGYYAWIRQRSGAELWRSPSAGTLALDAKQVAGVGSTVYRMQRLADGSELAVLSRGLSWEVAEGDNRDLEFSVAESTRPYQLQLYRFRRQMTGWFLLLALALLGTLAWRMRRALEPVRRLAREIGAVERGEQEKLSGNFPRELERVTRNLNALLKAERERITRYRDTLGNLAHSLKTPLAVIRASAAQEGAEAQRTIEAEVERMNQIVEHQLKRAAMSGSMTLGSDVVPVAPLVAELRAALLKVHAGRELVIEVLVEGEPGFGGDRGDLMELLGNLLDNACKWCRSRVRVRAALAPDAPLGERLCVCVEDDGPGIAAADRERVVERGVRADERQPGHGLGLAMVRDTIALYGGRFEIGTAAELGGARIALYLPGR
ncbi:MAG TPA: ATP-binding protein [Steroidobacteraceae bacterium]|nr:ATP-binding protein [Steroidobacteraceae bacterium]